MLDRPNFGTAMLSDVDATVAPFLNLVPNSGIQFIDLEISAERLQFTERVFLAETATGTADTAALIESLLEISSQSIIDGAIFHPDTGAVVPPDRTLSLTGYDGLEPFLDQWLPLPYFRQKHISPGAPLVSDDGPSNWARVFIARPRQPLKTAGTLKLVLAFDTRLDAAPRDSEGRYLAPTTDDERHDAVFAQEDDLQNLAVFLGEPWLDGWLSAAMASALGNDNAARFENEHIARYLTLLRVLKRHVGMPTIRFLNNRDRRASSPPVTVDLVLDIGTGQTTALLVERNSEAAFSALRDAVTLTIRDLSVPTERHTGPVGSEIEFCPPPFDQGPFSRMSGRSDAMHWPSLVRIGNEARRLSHRANAAAGVTGLADLKSRLNDTAESPTIWRFSQATADERPGAIVSGAILDHLAEDGELTDIAGSRPPAIRPKFSASSTLTFFCAELLLHAISGINSPLRPRAAGDTATRELRRIIVCCAAAAPEHERTLLLDRVANAVDLVWRNLGWEKSGPFAPKPQVMTGLDADLSAQMVFLFEELHDRFGRNIKHFVDLVRMRRASRPIWPSLRIASVDLGSGYSTIAFVDYDVTSEGDIQASLTHAERSAIAGDALVAAIQSEHIRPAIAAALAEAGLDDAAGWLAALLEGAGAAMPDAHRSILAGNLESRILRPAAIALKTLFVEQSERGLRGVREIALAELVALGNGKFEPTGSRLAAQAGAAGCRAIDLSSVTICLRWLDVSATIRGVMAPLADKIGGLVGQRDCDLVLLTGPNASLREAVDEMARAVPLPARRIVNMRNHEGTLLGMTAGHDASIDPTWLIGCAGAYLASRNVLGSDGFNLLATHLANDAAAAGEADGAPSLSAGIQAGAGTGTTDQNR